MADQAMSTYQIDCVADIRYSKLAAPPEALCKSLNFERSEQSSRATELEGLVVDLFSSSGSSFRHDKALEDKLFGKVLLLRKARKGRNVSAAVAVRECKAKRRCVARFDHIRDKILQDLKTAYRYCFSLSTSVNTPTSKD
jgi:hypothetical protein